MAANEKSLREHVLDLLSKGHAHLGFDDAVKGLPAALRGKKPDGLPYSVWQLVEHVRLAQEDILRFCVEPDYESPEWPAGYWPEEAEPPSAQAWESSLRGFRKDRKAMMTLVSEGDLLAPIPHAAPATILREALLVADHTAYHLGQIVTVRRLLDAWPGS